MKFLLQIGLLAAALLLTGGWAQAQGEQEPVPEQEQQTQEEQARPRPQNRQRLRGERRGPRERRVRAQQHVQRLMRHLISLSPDEQVKFLANDERVRRLPEPVRARVREHLDRFNAMTPEEQGAFRERMGRDRQGEMRRRMERSAALPADEQDQALRDDPGFQRMPAEAQERMRRQVRRMSRMSRRPAGERERMLERERRFSRMTLEQQEQARQVFAEWRRLPRERKQAIQEKLRQLRGLAPEARKQRLEDPAFLEGLEPSEQELMRELANLREVMPRSNRGRRRRNPGSMRR